ncbi:hypothetical protein PT2222_190061 [Paraburkholderia tropica]
MIRMTAGIEPEWIDAHDTTAWTPCPSRTTYTEFGYGGWRDRDTATRRCVEGRADSSSPHNAGNSAW